MLIGLLVVLPNPMDGIIRQQERFHEQLAQVEEDLQKTKEHVVGPDTSLSAEERAAAEEALEKLQEALTEAKDIPLALAALSEAEQEIGLLQEPKEGQSRGLGDVGSTLTASPTTQALGEALHSMDGAALRDAMDALARRVNSMSEDELQELAAALQRAANAATGSEALSGSLRQASRAIASGDPRASSGDLGDLADMLLSLQEGANASQALAKTLADLRGARSFISGVELAQAGEALEPREGGATVRAPLQGPVRARKAPLARARDQEVRAWEAPLAQDPVEARATSQAPTREMGPEGFSQMGRLSSFRARGQIFPWRSGPFQARELPLGGSSRIIKLWQSTRSRPESIWNAARFPKVTRTWYAAISRS